MKLGIILFLNLVLTLAIVFSLLMIPSIRDKLNFSSAPNTIITTSSSKPISTIAIPQEEPMAKANPSALAFKEGKGTYSGDVEASKLYSQTLKTEYGDIPFVLFCKATVTDWGLTTVYLDQVTDENIRYRRPSGRISPDKKLPGIIYSVKGDFIKTEGGFPPSDCEQKNLISKK